MHEIKMAKVRANILFGTINKSVEVSSLDSKTGSKENLCIVAMRLIVLKLKGRRDFFLGGKHTFGVHKSNNAEFLKVISGEITCKGNH